MTALFILEAEQWPFYSLEDPDVIALQWTDKEAWRADVEQQHLIITLTDEELADYQAMLAHWRAWQARLCGHAADCDPGIWDDAYGEGLTELAQRVKP